MASGLSATAAASADGKTAVPWVERYRPSQIDDVLAHQDIITTIRNFIDKKSLPHLLFYGPPGTGKTTTALAIARMIYTRYFAHQVLELNASDERGIDVVRKQIKDFSSTRNVYAVVPYKMIILDEADMMTSDAQAALRRVIELYTRNVRFVLICNHVHRLIPAIQSRCTRFRFQPLARPDMLNRLRHIATSEGVIADPPALAAIARLSNGDMRSAINILQAASLSAAPTAKPTTAAMVVDDGSVVSTAAATAPVKDGDAAGAEISEQSVYETLGYPTPSEVQSIVETMMSQQTAVAYDTVATLSVTRGYALADLLLEFSRFVQRMEIKDDAKAFMFERLADIEHNAAMGTNPSVHLAAVVAAFGLVRHAVAEGTNVLDLVR